jgi:riboflavin kinase / FMN adenylyltransferase
VQRWRGLDDVPPGWGRCVVTIGVFDGVHRGHQQIVGRAVRRAAEVSVPSVVLTFDPHPNAVVRPGTQPPSLSSPEYKAELLEGLGVDVLCVLPFTREFSRLEPAAFVEEVLVRRLHAARVVVGEDFRFGHRAAGDLDTLRGLGERFGFATEGVPLLYDGDVRVSSTFVRSCVEAGDVVAAAAALGRPHRVDGEVVRGDMRGRLLGYPTANLRAEEQVAVPADGVYAGYVRRAGERLPAAISVGSNPTFQGTQRRIEAYILDFDKDIYGETIGVEFVRRLRAMARFDSVDTLLAAIRRDVEQTRDLLLGDSGVHPL